MTLTPTEGAAASGAGPGIIRRPRGPMGRGATGAGIRSVWTAFFLGGKRGVDRLIGRSVDRSNDRDFGLGKENFVVLRGFNLTLGFFYLFIILSFVCLFIFFSIFLSFFYLLSFILYLFLSISLHIFIFLFLSFYRSFLSFIFYLSFIFLSFFFIYFQN